MAIAGESHTGAPLRASPLSEPVSGAVDGRPHPGGHPQGSRADNGADNGLGGVPRRPSLPEFERLRRALCAFASCRLPNEADAEDVAQETLLRLLGNLGDLETPAQVRAYALGIARHVICARYAGYRREHTVDPARCERWPAGEGISAPDPLLRLVRNERRDAVREAVARLPAPQREVVKECLLDDHTCAEVARESYQPAARVRKQKSRAVQRLRRDLFAAL